MELFVKNVNKSLRFCLTVLKCTGFLTSHMPGTIGVCSWLYCLFWFMFLDGTVVIAQAGAMFQIWGDLTQMTSTSFLLFTNMVLGLKIINVVVRRREIQNIIDEADDELRTEDREKGIEIIESCDRETTTIFGFYMFLCAVTVLGWASSAEKNQLPLNAWYPYDTTKSPAYEITYANQSIGVSLSAMVNACLDTLVTSLIAVCRCRLGLVRLSLRTLCEGIRNPEKQLLAPEDEKTVYSRLQQCAVRYEAVLSTVRQIQKCFSYPLLAQFTVSVVIICISAYQLAVEMKTKNWIRIISMIAYLLAMMLQVFLYCYQGNQLTEENWEIAGAAYECEWYKCSIRMRRSLLIVMVRTRRALCLTAGGFTTLSLDCFTAIIKASYTFFTVLQQV